MPKLPRPKLPSAAAKVGALARRAGAAEGAAAEGAAVESAFRLPTGEVVRTGSYHDMTQLPERWQTDAALEQVEAGFATPEGRFFTRKEAEQTLAAKGEPAPAARQAPPMPKVLSSGHSALWLRARAEALRRHAAGRQPEAARSFQRLAREAQEAGGFTYDVATGARPKRGFAFSVSPENEARVPELTPEAIAGYVESHESALLGPDAYLGAWRSPEGEWYLDVSRVLPGREEAMKAARAAKQRAVYDLERGESLELEP